MVKAQVRHSIAATLDYFIKDPALSEHECQGIWLGGGLSLTGIRPGQSILSQELECFLNGYSPSGQRLFSRKKLNRRCAWDCVVTADKSLSIAALCSLQAASVQAALKIAVMRLLYHFESLALRQDNAGTGKPRPTGNLIAAHYVHEASRHGDPHIHAHLVLINATYGTAGDESDRRWRSLEPANIYRNQTALRWVFNAELYRQLRLAGFRAQTDSEGITRLPVPREICRKYSRAHSAIAKMAAQLLETRTIPAQWERMQPPELINRLNDRSRPTKRLPPIDWQQLLSPGQKADLTQALLDSAIPTPRLIFAPCPPGTRSADSQPAFPPPPSRSFDDPERYKEDAAELLGAELAKTSLYYSPKAVKIATCRTAARNPDIPLGAFAWAAHWWSKHRPRITVFSRSAASRLQEMSRKLSRSRSKEVGTPHLDQDIRRQH